MKWWWERSAMFTIWSVLHVNNVVTGNVNSLRYQSKSPCGIFIIHFKWMANNFWLKIPKPYMHQISKPKINYFHCAHGQITDSVSETGFICVIIKSYAKMTMPIVKCNHNWRINRMSVAITTASTATATTMSTITTVSSISIGIQTKARRLIHRIAWCHCIRRRIISQISMFRFMFDKLLFATH